MARKLKNPFTIRITAADIIDSQLTVEDLDVLKSSDGDEGGVLCPGVYCSGGYSGEGLTADAVINPAERGA